MSPSDHQMSLIYCSAFALVRYNSDGSLDSGFGSGGKIIHGVSTSANIWSGMPPCSRTGKSLRQTFLSIKHSWIIIRCNPNGSRDTSFAANGVFTPETNLYIGNGIALQTDGKLVSFGYENSGGNHRFAILR